MTNLHPIFDRLVSRAEKEARLQQRGQVIWLFGLSGSGKSTIASALERELHEAGRLTKVLDGDNLRTGVNQNLGFSDEDRRENIRRAAQVAKLFAETGIITLVSVITPRRELRRMLREIIAPEDLRIVYVRASYETCARRDPKGLYAKVAAGQVKQFTGKDSGFEEPDEGEVDLVVDTETHDVVAAVAAVRAIIRSRTGA